MQKTLLGVALTMALSGCGAERVWAPDDAVDRARYRTNTPPSLTLVTVLATRDGSGAHTGLLINASEQVMWDPAGTFKTSSLPERNDVLFGMTPRAFEIYVDYHARSTFDVVLQEVPVSAEVAQRALLLAQKQGPASKAACTTSTSSILRQLSGFEDAPSTFFPRRLMSWMSDQPKVTERIVVDDDGDNNKPVLAEAEARLN